MIKKVKISTKHIDNKNQYRYTKLCIGLFKYR